MEKISISDQETIYLEEVTYNVEKIKDYLKKALIGFHMVYGSLSNKYSMILNRGEYFSLDYLNGIIIEEDEFITRKKVLDLLKLFKNMFKDIFHMETCEAKLFSNLEKYVLIGLDDSKESHILVEFLLEKENKNIATFTFENLNEKIAVIFKNYYSNQLPFDNAYHKILISLIQKNKPEVLKCLKEVKEILNCYLPIVTSKDNYLEVEEEVKKSHIPLLIEIGPSNVKKNQLTIISSLGKKQVLISNLLEEVLKLKEELNYSFYQRSFKEILIYQRKVMNLEEIKEGNRFCLCLDQKCVNQVESLFPNKRIYHTFSNLCFSKKCIVCNQEARNIVFLSK